MRLADYNFEEEVICAIEEYERDKNPSLNGIIEEFVKGLLYEQGYLRYELSEDEIFNPKELNKIDNFSKSKWGDGKVQIKYGDLTFGSFDEEIADEIIFRLIRLPEEDFIKYSKTYCQENFGYSSKDYSNFILKWLEDDSMVPEDLGLLRRTEYPSSKSVEFRFKRILIAGLNKKKYPSEKIDEVELFLNRFSGPQLQEIIEMRKESGIKSDKFILDLMDNPKEIERIMQV
ncbi:MAG: hypothetical protein IJF83_05760 [Methanobrevibacter sp.]|nr:hypothetical protein [Methanobrevibacter sp.]